MTKHTPAPWTISEDYRAGMSWNRHIVQESNPDIKICFMTSDGNSKANAALIAAAPTMASRIQGALDCLSQNRVFPGDIARAKGLLIEALETAEIKPLSLNEDR
jgi:hypothetical protein